MSREMRVEIDPDICTGHGRCYELAPHVFTEDVRGHAVALVRTVQGDLLVEARRAATNCPEMAIRLRSSTRETVQDG